MFGGVILTWMPRIPRCLSDPKQPGTQLLQRRLASRMEHYYACGFYRSIRRSRRYVCKHCVRVMEPARAAFTMGEDVETALPQTCLPSYGGLLGDAWFCLKQ
ncbi:hypothetical protein M3J09_002177 [Ascochyta lentis]